ncbi:MAG: gliding motility-associated C-terminal domain-containing protein, partial [Bacteroidota bacterium]
FGIAHGYAFVPTLADLDGDGDKDLIGGANSYASGDPVGYFKNEAGEFIEQPFATGPFSTVTTSTGKTDFVDIDNDGDLDMFISDFYNGTHTILYYKNTGTAQIPTFTYQLSADNPLSMVSEEFGLYPRFVDIDHDGDFDALIGEGGYYGDGQQGNEFLFYENIGTPSAPQFVFTTNLIAPGSSTTDPSPAFVDFDGDGDLDLMEGSRYGIIVYYLNTNPVPVTVVASGTKSLKNNEILIVDPTLTITDSDNDEIVEATVTISNFIPGSEVLTFTPQPGITGSFNTSTGVLSFRGLASVATYQTLLRSLSFQFTGANPGRKDPQGRVKDVNQNITFRVFDADHTTPAAVSVGIQVNFNAPPVITPDALTAKSGETISLNLIDIISDPDNNLDPNSIVIVQQPTSGATATLQFVSATEVNLLVNYFKVTFNGNDQVRIRACDALGACTENVITISINASAEVLVYNAVAPNSSGDNKYMRIMNLPQGNRVSVYNRWGDEVFSTENYYDEFSGQGKRFEGFNDNGKALSSGTYFYKIEFADGSKTITGFLSLKQ